MKTIQKNTYFAPINPLVTELLTEDSILFDIETTGFSPKSSSLYLIGCCYRQNEQLCFTQFLAENETEEREVLAALMDLLHSFHTMISFNGIGFDLPYLKAKCDFYELKESFLCYSSLDLFQEVTKLKHVLNLANYKQKTVEEFLGIRRQDRFNGGELIEMYKLYEFEPTEEAEELLLLHNYEDVMGIMDLLPILSFTQLLHGQYQIKSVDINDKVTLTLKADYPFPTAVHCSRELYSVFMRDETVEITIPVYAGTLRFFYPNYKDYYYLPAEDRAIHKSVATNVDKDYRKQATASNCYTTKDDLFLPQFASIMQPAFKKEYKDKVQYFSLTEDFCSSDVLLRRYIDHLLVDLYQ